MRPITVRVACVQLRARSLREAPRALEDVQAGIAAAAAQRGDIAVFPECSYPGYVLLRKNPYRSIPSAAQALATIATAARRAGIAVCVGVARPDARGALRNESVFIDRRGHEVARYAKVFLWNFDARWFAPGTSVPVFETEFGRLGMMICADGRMPEIARTLARKGAWLVLDPTAWVAVGPAYDRMHNPQVEFMMRVRARENGIWIAAADKCGSENAGVHYVGRSMIVTPDGSVSALGPADAPAVIVADVRRGAAAPFVADVSPRERRALASAGRGRGAARGPVVRLGIFQGPIRVGRAAALQTLSVQGAAAVVDTSASAATIRKALARVRSVRFALIDGAQMLAPEPARAAALGGADILFWIRPAHSAFVRDLARTRALENRVYVVVCARSSDAHPACLVDPNGSIEAQALQGMPSGFVANVETARARDKVVVPGSDVFGARIPKAFALFDGRTS